MTGFAGILNTRVYLHGAFSETPDTPGLNIGLPGG
jgi:hypothetical protein